MTTYFAPNDTKAGLRTKVTAWMQSQLDNWRTTTARRKIYRTALRELADMSDADLLQLGLRRCDIHRTAWETAVALEP